MDHEPWSVASVALCVCLCVLTLKGKRLELLTSNLIDTQCMAVTQHGLTLMSKGQGQIIKCTASVRMHVGWASGRASSL